MLTDMQREALEVALESIVRDGKCGPVGLGAICVIQDMLMASAAPAEGREPTGDELRKLVREIRDASGGPSDAPQPADYVLGGWRAAIATAPTKPAEGRTERTACCPYCTDPRCAGCLATAPTMSEATYREVGVWAPDGSKFRTYRAENLNGRAMFVRDTCEPIDRAAAKGGSDEQ